MRIIERSYLFSTLVWLGLVTCRAWADQYTNNIPGYGLYSTFVNAFDRTNTLNDLLPAIPGGTVTKWDCQNGFAPPVVAYDSVQGWKPNLTLAPGQGVAVYNPGAAKSRVIETNPPVPSLPLALPCGCGQTNFIGGQSVATHSYESVTGRPVLEGAMMTTWDITLQAWVDHVFTNGAWSPSVPVLPPWQAALIYVPCDPGANVSATLTSGAQDSVLTLGWPALYRGWRLQVQTNTPDSGLSGNWYDVIGATTTNRMLFNLDPAKGPVFYRLASPN